MKKKIFLSICLCSLITMVLTGGFITSVYYVNFQKELERQVDSQCEYLKDAAEVLIENESTGFADYSAYLEQVGKKTGFNRLTLILSDGTVYYDSDAGADLMENHLEREEIIEAAQSGTGSAVRRSDTLGSSTYYRAAKLSDGNFLRIAYVSKSLPAIFGSALIWAVFIFVFVLIVAVAAAALLTSRIIRPINLIDPENPVADEAYEELSPLLRRMEKQNEKIGRQLQSLSDQQQEFDFITENMSEGLVIFGENGTVLSANAAARSIFGTETLPGYYTGLCRDREYLSIIKSALDGAAQTCRLFKEEKVYQLFATPVKAGLKSYAAVLFIVDVTEKEESEKLRREFSANVSHELKTPLTSIMGYAEIIGNGIAKTEDIPKFTGQIRDEAARLLALIQDIIKLSRLDEGDLRDEFEQVDLQALCTGVSEKLSEKARLADVTIVCDTEPCVVNGFKPVLYEMIYNLCDNAVAYNKRGGKVTLSLHDKKLVVADTGIGIAPEDKERVFERFYRVDKSHSKETGGTGLGLSIVKHGAILHNAELSLESRQGEGTEITVLFR